jgi:hypothetical protein
LRIHLDLVVCLFKHRLRAPINRLLLLRLQHPQFVLHFADLRVRARLRATIKRQRFSGQFSLPGFGLGDKPIKRGEFFVVARLGLNQTVLKHHLALVFRVAQRQKFKPTVEIQHLLARLQCSLLPGNQVVLLLDLTLKNLFGRVIGLDTHAR